MHKTEFLLTEFLLMARYNLKKKIVEKKKAYQLKDIF